MRRLSLKSTDFGVDPKNQPIPQPLVLTQKSTYSTTFGVDRINKGFPSGKPLFKRST